MRASSHHSMASDTTSTGHGSSRGPIARSPSDLLAISHPHGALDWRASNGSIALGDRDVRASLGSVFVCDIVGAEGCQSQALCPLVGYQGVVGVVGRGELCM